MMIAISVFLVVVTSGMNALLNANMIHQKSRDMRSIMDNLSFILEDMSRNLRTGSNYHCFAGGDTIPGGSMGVPKSSPSGDNCWGIAFEATGGDALDDSDQWVYYIANGKIFKLTEGPYVESDFIRLTPDDVEIDAVSGFSVLGATSPAVGDSQQPLVTIRIVGNITYRGVVTPFSLQTSVSQRLVDI
jgi:hypothetical protein